MTTSKNGYFVISLDFELFWGVFDVVKDDSYKSNIRNVRHVIPRLLELANAYKIKLSFATVGFLFADNKTNLLESLPLIKPEYGDSNFSPYNHLKSIGETEVDDPCHFAPTLFSQIHSNDNHEIGSHTFSHYYCNEKGQTINQFEEDLIAAIGIARKKNIAITSIVFPRNQINKDYLLVCKKHGITCYRGTEKSWMYNTHDTQKLEQLHYKAFRLLDAYCNITGFNTTPLDELIDEQGIVNLPSSKFLRPYSKKLKVFEPLRLKRIVNGMTYAAQQNEMYHLWWHPHNFGSYIDENFKNLEVIFKHYSDLNKKFNFKSETMSGLALQIRSN